MIKLYINVKHFSDINNVHVLLTFIKDVTFLKLFFNFAPERNLRFIYTYLELSYA